MGIVRLPLHLPCWILLSYSGFKSLCGTAKGDISPPSSATAPQTLPVSSGGSHDAQWGTSSICSVPLVSGSTCSVPLVSGSTCSVPLMSGSTCSVPLVSGSTCSVHLVSGSICSVHLVTCSTCSVPLVSGSTC